LDTKARLPATRILFSIFGTVKAERQLYGSPRPASRSCQGLIVFEAWGPGLQEASLSLRCPTIVLVVSASLSLGSATVAFAHAHLVRAIPAAGGTLHEAPNDVTLYFSERLEQAFSSVVVRDADGKEIDNKDSMVDKSDRTVIRVSLPSLEPGVYKVEWRAVSADTHKVSGDFTFKVGD
jgi:copper resistance protein C